MPEMLDEIGPVCTIGGEQCKGRGRRCSNPQSLPRIRRPSDRPIHGNGGMARIVLDRLSHQAIRHLGSEVEDYDRSADQSGRYKGARLAGLFELVAAMGHHIDIVLPEAPHLANAAVLIIAGRSHLRPFNDSEKFAIADLRARGGSLLLMADHSGFIAAQHDLATALALPVSFHDAIPPENPELQLVPHDLTQLCGRLQIRDAARLHTTPDATIVAHVASAPAEAFAVAIEGCSFGQGRVLATGDSDFIASSDDAGEPMFEAASNARFIENAIRWLLDPP